MAEIWLPVVGYEGFYEVSSEGRVRSLDRIVKKWNGERAVPTRLLSLSENSHGYLSITLCKDGKAETKTVHRIVAEAFIPNNNHYPQINHINGNKHDNRVENLEWCSASQNVQHAYDSLKRDIGPSRYIQCVETQIVYRSCREAGRKTGLRYQNIWRCAKGTLQTTGGYHFKFYNNDEGKPESCTL